MKLEAVVIPVTDPDRSKAFYGGLGWRLDADFSFDNGFRVPVHAPRAGGPFAHSPLTARGHFADIRNSSSTKMLVRA